MGDVEETKKELQRNPDFPVKVRHCGVCTMPLEYCEYSGTYDKCKKWAEANVSDLVAAVTVSGGGGGGEGAAAAAEGGDNKEEGGESSAAAAEQEDKKHQKRGGKGGKKGEEKAKKKGQITVQRAPRGKKSVTVVKGLSTFDIDLKVAAKFFAGKFACGSSVTGADEIVIQGDVKDDLFDLIPEKWAAVTEDDIEDLGDQKR